MLFSIYLGDSSAQHLINYNSYWFAHSFLHFFKLILVRSHQSQNWSCELTLINDKHNGGHCHFDNTKQSINKKGIARLTFLKCIILLLFCDKTALHIKLDVCTYYGIVADMSDCKLVVFKLVEGGWAATELGEESHHTH